MTIEVTHELSSAEAVWVGESRSAAHVTLPLNIPGPVVLTTASDSFPNGNPAPGGGQKKITYTFTVQNGWDWTFDASMLYKKMATDVNPTTKPLTQIKGKAVK